MSRFRIHRAGSHRTASAGFTLLETLVMLLLVSFAVTLMFEMLGTYRIARERAAAYAGTVDRQALFEAWLRDVIRGLHPTATQGLAGTPTAFRALTLNGLRQPPGAPVDAQWDLVPGQNEWTVRYTEAGTLLWELPLRATREARFVYFDTDGKSHDAWPPATGLHPALPRSIALVREDDSGSTSRTLVASVLGPLDPRLDPFELEQE